MRFVVISKANYLEKHVSLVHGGNNQFESTYNWLQENKEVCINNSLVLFSFTRHEFVEHDNFGQTMKLYL